APSALRVSLLGLTNTHFSSSIFHSACHQRPFVPVYVCRGVTMRTSHTSLCNAIRRKLTALSARREKAARLREESESKAAVKAEEVAALDAQIDLLQTTPRQFDPDAEPPAPASPAATTPSPPASSARTDLAAQMRAL